MTDPSYPQLRAHHRCVAAMMDDPACVGDLLLIGVALAGALHLGDPAPVGGGLHLKMLSRRVYGNAYHATQLAWMGGGHERVSERGVRRLEDVLRHDIRRYRPVGERSRKLCGRPMIKRDGVCGRPANRVWAVVDPATGERDYVGCCATTVCRAWLDNLVAANRRELAAHPAPVPAANHGGVLARHLDAVDWVTLWRHLDPDWVIPPEVEAWKPPTLRLILNDTGVEPAARSRPDLVGIDGGWR